mgnify:CR=1 FL=1
MPFSILFVQIAWCKQKGCLFAQEGLDLRFVVVVSSGMMCYKQSSFTGLSEKGWNMTPEIAVLDDEPRMAEVLAMLLRREKYSVHVFNRPGECLEACKKQRFDLLLTDLKMPDMDGVEVLRKIKALDPTIPVILVTAHATIRTAIEAMREGAFDYVEKPFDSQACKRLVRRALAFTELERENRYLREELRSRYDIDNLITVSPKMQSVLDRVQRAARGRATVLISGESGTGKEVIARAIHYYSDRVGKPFVAVNCKAFASGVLESELFGHEKGAFTGASYAKPGVFERASGGTLFLDEIGEIDLSFQAKLLRVLQEREVQRVGGEGTRPVDVRVVAATNRDLLEEVKEGRFREDLYFRLAVIPLFLPPLRERGEDILPLARHFLVRWNQEMGRSITGWTPEVETYLTEHRWPGNIRELENALERAVVLAREEIITLEDLVVQETLHRKDQDTQELDDLTLHAYLDKAAAERIRKVLKEVRGVRIDAARRLGIERTTLYRLMKKFGISETDLQL